MTVGEWNMVRYAYIRVLSDEANVRAIHLATNLSDASIKATKAPKDEHGVWWNWMTARTEIKESGANDEVTAVLAKYRPFFPLIREHAAADADIYLEIVTQYGEGEDPTGLYLSAETIQLLSELGGALDHDVYALRA